MQAEIIKLEQGLSDLKLSAETAVKERTEGLNEYMKSLKAVSEKAAEVITQCRRDIGALSAEKESHEKFLRESKEAHTVAIKKHESLISEKAEHISKLETSVTDHNNKIDSLEIKIKGLLSEIKVVESSIPAKRTEATALDLSVRSMKIEEDRLIKSISQKKEEEAKLLASNEEAKKEFARLSSEAKLLADRAK
jgi:hypothetical protein